MDSEYIHVITSSFSVINFLIMLLILVWVFKKCNLGSLIDNLSENIKTSVKTSENIVENAIIEYKKAKKEASNKDVIKEEIIQSARNTISEIEKNNLEKIKNEEEELSKSFDKTKDGIYKNKLEKTTDEIRDIVYVLSKETIIKKMTPEIQKRVIKNCLDELENLEGVEI